MSHNTVQDKPRGDGACERVTGPFKGYHVIAIGCQVGSLGAGFRGYYKICRGHPDSYWTAHSTAQGRCGPVASSSASAVRMAQSAAAAMIDGMAASEADAHSAS